MFTLDDIRPLKVYNKKLHLPLSQDSRREGSAIFLLTPNIESSINLINNKIFINNNYFNAYYIEKDSTFYINQEGYLEDITSSSFKNVINESNLIKSNDLIIAESGLLNDIKEEYLNEGYFITTKDIEYKVDSWKNGSSNALFVTGLSGSGKSTESKELAKEYNAIIFELDMFQHNMMLFNNKSNLSEGHRIMKDIISKKYGSRGKKFNVSAEEFRKELSLFVHELLEICKKNKDQKYIFEGLQIKRFDEKLCEEIKEYPIIIKNTSVSKSMYQRFKRDYNTSDGSFKNPYKLLKWYINSERELNDFRNKTKDINEASDEVLSDPKRLKRSLLLRANKAKYKLNQLADNDRNTVGTDNTNGDTGNIVPMPSVQTPNVQITSPETPKIYQPNMTNTNGEKEVEESYFIGHSFEECVDDDNFIRAKLPNGKDIIIIKEVNNRINANMKKALYKDRFRNNTQVNNIYKMVKANTNIKKTAFDYKMYKNKNLFIDLSYYNQAFFNNNILKLDRGVDLYFSLISRFVFDDRLDSSYNKRTVVVPLQDWKMGVPTSEFLDYYKSINIISCLIRMVKKQKNKLDLSKWAGIDFLFMNGEYYFKIDISTLNRINLIKFENTIIKLLNRESESVDLELGNKKETPKSMELNIINKIENGTGMRVNNLTGGENKETKEELIKKIEDATVTASDADEAIKTLDTDESFKKILYDLASDEENNIKTSVVRKARGNKLNDQFLKKELEGKTIDDLISGNKEINKIESTNLSVDSVNEDWNDMKYINFEEGYNMHGEILDIMYSLSKTSSPVYVVDFYIEDSSTSEDLKETYTFKLEDFQGTRFTIKFDVPILKNNKFMTLRGNDKTISGQLMLLPIIKTDDDTVQVVSNYKKIFIKRYGSTLGKSYYVADIISKFLNKVEDKSIKVTKGDNRKICHKYELPVDYIDLASQFTKIETKNYIIYFNQDEIRETYKDLYKKNKNIAIAYNKKNKCLVFADMEGGALTYSDLIYSILAEDSQAFKDYKPTLSSKYVYSKASIMSNNIPLIIVMAYNEGLSSAMKKSNIEFDITEKNDYKGNVNWSAIKFKDGYLNYKVDLNSSLLMNGLKESPTEIYSITEINKKSMYLDFLDNYGGRILADGLDNFYDLMVDPDMEDRLKDLNLPTDYISILAYANLLLTDNKYFKHTDMTGKRYRSSSIISGYAYNAISTSYGKYKREVKMGKKATMTMKQNQIIDSVLLDPTCSDKSDINALLDAESMNAVSTKGLSGMNNDRSYNLDKRTFDKSMIGVLGMSTGFAGNVGITRQTTIDMNVANNKGYLTTTEDISELGTAKMFTMTEAVNPYGVTRDDPFRSAMNYIQTSKHGMRVKGGMPCLISNGADMVLPYTCSDTFSFKAKDNGKVIVKEEDYMIVSYKNGSNDFIDLRNTIKKNSNGGFYTDIKLDTDLKLGSTFKQKDILAYDKLSFSDVIGDSKDIAYNLGVLSKIAIMNTDEGYEDSAIITKWMSKAMTSEIVVKKEVSLPKSTNIFNMVKKGTPVQEGDPLIIFQNAFEDEDMNILLKNLADDEEEISDLGRIPIRSKITGIVDDIKVYRTVDLEELSPSLKSAVNKYEKSVNEFHKITKQYGVQNNDIQTTGKLDPTGNLRDTQEGVKIEFYLRYNDEMGIGDKLIYSSALKGVVKDIIPEGEEPYTDFRQNENIQSMLSLGSVSGRMVCSILLNCGINKVLIEMDRKVKETLGIEWKNLDKM